MKLLVKSFAFFNNEKDIANFLRDLMTLAEINEFENRLKIAKLLLKKDKSYCEIAKKVGTSTTTVTRVAHWLFHGQGGYQKLLKA